MKRVTKTIIFSITALLLTYILLVAYLCSTEKIAYLIVDTVTNGTPIVPNVLAEFFLFNTRGNKKDIAELKTKTGGLNYIVACLDRSNFSKAKKSKYLRFFISKGLNVNGISDIDGLRPLHTAASDGNAEVAELLLENGADPFLKSGPTDISKSMTPLEMVERYKMKITHIDYDKVIEVLRKAEERRKAGKS